MKRILSISLVMAMLVSLVGAFPVTARLFSEDERIKASLDRGQFYYGNTLLQTVKILTVEDLKNIALDNTVINFNPNSFDLDKYDELFFYSNFLVFYNIVEPSGSIVLEVTSVNETSSSVEIEITRHVTSPYTDDEGPWILVLEMDRDLIDKSISLKPETKKHEKIDAELWEVMTNAPDDYLITVWLWLIYTADNETIAKKMIEEKGLNPNIYDDNPFRFQEKFVEEIIKQYEASVGYWEALNIAIDEYVITRRAVVSRLYSAFNNDFIEKYVNPKREIIYNSRYTSTLIVEATKLEIESYANNDMVSEVSLFVDLALVPDPAATVTGKICSYDPQSETTVKPIEGAVVTLQIMDENGDWSDWDAESYAQNNPQTTDREGRYGWYVPNGKYRVLVSAEGYKDYCTDIDGPYGVITIPPSRTDIDIGLEAIEESIVYGDVDGDGMITPFDATLVLQHIVGMITLEGRALKAADTDHDGLITPFDATLILQYIVGMITSFN